MRDYATFAAAVKQHLATDEDRQSGYTYIERREDQKLDGSGRAREDTVRVFEKYPGLPGEEPLPPADRIRRQATYSDYRKFTVDTSTTYSHVSR
jgi:hypothetical protein